MERKQRPGSPWLISIFVWLVWLLACAWLLWFVDFYGANYPLWDEWQNVPFLTGTIPLTWDNLCRSWGDHRLPLLRLVLIGLARCTHFDFRAPMFVSVLLLAALSAAFLVFVRRQRGQLKLVDAFVPLVCLNAGHAENLLQGGNVQNIAFAFLAGMALLCIDRRPAPSKWGCLVLSVCVIVLPWMTGGAGVVLALPLVAVLAGNLWRPSTRHADSGEPSPGEQPRANEGMSWRIAAFVLTIGAGCGASEYVRRLPSSQAAAVSLSDALLGSAYFLSTPFAGYTTWPHWAALVAVTALLGAFAGMCWIGLWRCEGWTFRTVGTLGFLAGMAVLALSVGWGRAGLGPTYCLATRYAALATPMALAVYLLAILGGGRAGGIVPWVLLLVLLPGLVVKTQEGAHAGEWNSVRSLYFRRDVASGLSGEALASRHPWLIPGWDGSHKAERDRQAMIDGVRLLRERSIGIFAEASSKPDEIERTVPRR